VPYDAWVRDGHIEATPGNVIDFQYIIDQILVLVGMFGLQEVGYDPWNATQTAIELQSAGIEMVETRQGYKTMSEPSKQLESLVRSGKLSHNGQPVLRWNAANVTVRTDGNENFMPDKKHSMERIDGIVALVMALSRAMVHEAPQIPQSIYNSTALNHG
jgi:phage terminase large subunit-like protein